MDYCFLGFQLPKIFCGLLYVLAINQDNELLIIELVTLFSMSRVTSIELKSWFIIGNTEVEV